MLTGQRRPGSGRIDVLKLAALGAALFSSLAVAAAPACAAAPAQPPSFTVRLLTANGSGCPAGSAAVHQVSGTGFTVTYKRYTAAAGRGARPIDFRKNCQLNTLVGIPAGWTVGVGEVDYRGYAHLGRGARGEVGASYYIAGQPGTSRQSHEIPGPAVRYYAFSDKAAVVSWAPCTTSVGLNINTELRVYAGSDPSYRNLLTMDITKGTLGTVYHLAFRRC
jgi:uncharacterized protein DUF4360